MNAPMTPAASPPSLAGDPDFERARGGDLAAFGRLIQPEEARLFRQALALCRNESVAKELAQETLLAAWKGIERFDGQCRLFTWLYAILFRVHKKHLRSQARKPLIFWGLNPWKPRPDHPETVEIPHADENPVTSTLASERREALGDLIASLPKKHQEVIRLRFYADASLEEIAAATETSLGTVKSRLHYALEKLRQKNPKQSL